MTTITPFLMFPGTAEAAMRLYTGLFADAEILAMTHYPEGTVMHATFRLLGQQFHCIDSNIEHEFTFTPAISFSVSCDSEAEIDRLFAELSVDGAVLMPLAAYPFAAKYAWVQDRFGVSWQLSLDVV